MAYEQKGRCAEALNEFRIVQTLADGRDGTGGAHTFAVCGQRREALRALKALTGPMKYPTRDWFYVAGVFAAVGDNDQAFDWLNKALQNHDFYLTEMAAHPYMDPLRSDPRFGRLIKRVRFPRGALPVPRDPGTGTGPEEQP
jgi:tetratricopeptide (TPR) repeat protein